jgi:hypothetical protein
MTHEELIADYEKQLALRAHQEQAIRGLMGEPVVLSGAWKVNGTVGFAAAAVYIQLHGMFDLEKGQHLKFEGTAGGIALAGGEFRGEAVFAVSLEELTRGSVFVEAYTLAVVGGGIIMNWSRDFKPLGTFKGTGFGLLGGAAWGSGNFSLLK